MSDQKLSHVLRLVDEANSSDPNDIELRGERRPAAKVYGERMSAMLHQFQPDAADHLQIAARAQHIERWKSPRSDFPEGRAGYLRWRTELKAFHARRVGELMEQVGYDQDAISRVGALIRKEGLKRDEEVQTLEDVVCLVFLTFYASDFIAPHDDAKVIGILAKTARKMSSRGLEAAGNIALPDRLGRLLTTALSD